MTTLKADSSILNDSAVIKYKYLKYKSKYLAQQIESKDPKDHRLKGKLLKNERESPVKGVLPKKERKHKPVSSASESEPEPAICTQKFPKLTSETLCKTHINKNAYADWIKKSGENAGELRNCSKESLEKRYADSCTQKKGWFGLW